MTKKPIYKVSDFKGLKLGMVSKLWTGLYDRLGISGVSITGAEQYTALQRGTIDGIIYPTYTVETYKFHEVIKYITYPPIINPVDCATWINVDVWKSLTPELRKTIEEVSHEAELRAIEGSKKLTARCQEFASTHGVTNIKMKKADYEELFAICMKTWDDYAALDAASAAVAKSLREYVDKRDPKIVKEFEEKWLS